MAFGVPLQHSIVFKHFQSCPESFYSPVNIFFGVNSGTIPAGPTGKVNTLN